LRNEEKQGLFKTLSYEVRKETEEKEKAFLEKYRLYDFKGDSTRRNYLENLYIIELLEKYIQIPDNRAFINVLDIGSKDWFYVQGEYRFFKYQNKEKEVELTGIELDAYRVYINFYSRFDAAEYHMRNLEGVRYIPGDFLFHQGEYDYITWFFPFLTEKPLLKWGLPLYYLRPEQMLKHAYRLLKPEGEMLIVNQEIKEYHIQQQLLNKLNIPYKAHGKFKSHFLDYTHNRYVITVKKGTNNC